MKLVPEQEPQPTPAQETSQPQTPSEKLLTLKATAYDVLNEINRLTQIAQAINQEIAELSQQQNQGN